MNTAKERFIEDYTLVIDNDFNAYNEALEIARGAKYDLVATSEKLREQYEQFVDELADRESERGNETGAMLIRQIMGGWGATSFDAIARHYIGKDEE